MGRASFELLQTTTLGTVCVPRGNETFATVVAVPDCGTQVLPYITHVGGYYNAMCFLGGVKPIMLVSI